MVDGNKIAQLEAFFKKDVLEQLRKNKKWISGRFFVENNIAYFVIKTLIRRNELITFKVGNLDQKAIRYDFDCYGEGKDLLEAENNLVNALIERKLKKLFKEVFILRKGVPTHSGKKPKILGWDYF